MSATMYPHAELHRMVVRCDGDGNGARPTAGDLLHVAIVVAGEDVCFVTAARSPKELALRLADYVRERAPLGLWPEDARVVDELLSNGRVEEAGVHYFRTVGNRWDAERLVVTTVADEAPAGTR